MIVIPHKHFYKIENSGLLSSSFSEATLAMIQIPERHYKKKKTQYNIPDSDRCKNSQQNFNKSNKINIIWWENGVCQRNA